MESFLLAVRVVFPLLFFMAAGVLIRQLGILTMENFKAMNKMIFKILIPAALFMNIYKADIRGAMNVGLFVFAFLGVVLSFIMIWIVMGRVIQNQQDAATVIQGIYRSNFVLFGMTIGTSMCPGDGTAAIAALSAIVVPMFNILAVILFESMRGSSVSVKAILIGIAKNPLVGSGIIGMVFNLLRIPLPELFLQSLSDLGDIATPLALVTLGGMLTVHSIMQHKSLLFMATVGKLVVLPLVMVIIGILLGYRNSDLVAILAIFASPAAVASAPMAQSMGGNGVLAGEIVAITSAGCILTLFLFVLILSGTGMLA